MWENTQADTLKPEQLFTNRHKAVLSKTQHSREMQTASISGDSPVNWGVASVCGSHHFCDYLQIWKHGVLTPAVHICRCGENKVRKMTWLNKAFCQQYLSLNNNTSVLSIQFKIKININYTTRCKMDSFTFISPMLLLQSGWKHDK